MSSAFSTITSNVNLLLVNSLNISLNAPYIAYVSSVSIPGRIATVRDAVGLVSSPGRLIIVSTLKDVRFSDNTSSITISQPFGYISLSSRDKNTWDVINTFAFPMPSPVSYISSLYATDGLNANYLLSRTYLSTKTVTTDSISSYRIQASTISTANLFSQNISTQNLRSFNNIFTNVSSQTVSTNFIYASNVSTNTTTSRNVLVSSVNLFNTVTNIIVTLSTDGQALLVNGIPTGTFKGISTATTTLNMNNNSISNVQTVSTINLTASNINNISLSTINIQSQNVSTNKLYTNIISSIYISTNNIYTNTLSSSNIESINISTNSSFTNNLRVNTISRNLSNQINILNNMSLCNNDISNISNVYTNYLNLTNLGIPYKLAMSSIVGSIAPLMYSRDFINYRAVAQDWSYYRPMNNIDISNNVISNISQATLLNSVQTTTVMPISLLVNSNSSSYTIVPDGDADLFNRFNVKNFTFVNTGFVNYNFIIQFNGVTQCNSNTGTNGYYFYLSNGTQNNVVYGRNFNSNIPYLYLQNESVFRPDINALTFNDIFNLSGWNTGDIIYPSLRVFNAKAEFSYFFSNVNFSIIYQPLFS